MTPLVLNISHQNGRRDNKLVKINVSKVTAENLIKNNDQELIEKWIKMD
jgi:CDP-diacylglycerol pyrophosphatase